MDAKEEFGKKIYLTKETVDRALVNIDLVDRAHTLLANYINTPNFELPSKQQEFEKRVLDWIHDYQKSKT